MWVSRHLPRCSAGPAGLCGIHGPGVFPRLDMMGHGSPGHLCTSQVAKQFWGGCPGNFDGVAREKRAEEQRAVETGLCALQASPQLPAAGSAPAPAVSTPVHPATGRGRGRPHMAILQASAVSPPQSTWPVMPTFDPSSCRSTLTYRLNSTFSSAREEHEGGIQTARFLHFS